MSRFPRSWWRRLRGREGPAPGPEAFGEPVPLVLVPFYFPTGQGAIDALGRQLAASFGFRVERHAPGFDPEIAFDAQRGQYDSRKLLLELLAHHPTPGKVLGVTDLDLFVPVLTFVFGEAQLGGAAAVVSSHRLDPVRYGLPPDPRLQRERLLKEAVHEIGHTWSLRHCEDGRCAMASSSVVESIDLKSTRLCSDCRERMMRERRAAGSGRSPA